MNSLGGGSANDAARIFEAFDIKETSYHFICDKINLHLLDDPGSKLKFIKLFFKLDEIFCMT